MKEWITSRQNPQIRLVCGLAEKKKRRETGWFRFDGIKLLHEALANGIDLHAVFLRASSAERIVGEASARFGDAAWRPGCKISLGCIRNALSPLECATFACFCPDRGAPLGMRCPVIVLAGPLHSPKETKG